MADGIESFDEMKNLNRVKAGWRGGNQFKNGAEAPARTFVDGHPPEIAQMMSYEKPPQSTPIDTWFGRK